MTLNFAKCSRSCLSSSHKAEIHMSDCKNFLSFWPFYEYIKFEICHFLPCQLSFTPVVAKLWHDSWIYPHDSAISISQFQCEIFEHFLNNIWLKRWGHPFFNRLPKRSRACFYNAQTLQSSKHLPKNSERNEKLYNGSKNFTP